MNASVLLVKEKNGVVTLTLNRPEVMNSLNFPMLHALRDQIESLRSKPNIRVVIITATGEKAFCSGADLKERATLAPDQVREYIFTIRNLFTSIEQLNKAVIAAINGIALGGGTELALASDIRIASLSAGGTQRLPRLVGRGKAKELIFTGQRIGAQEALNIGLVNKICEPKDLPAETQKMADMICEAGPIAIEQAKYAINYGLETDIHTGLAIESNAYWVCIPTEDRLEGLAAFKEKRKPVYKGR
jgi:enoyl-CoA hydratase/carnithine racemase